MPPDPRHRLLEAAEALFAAGGYDGVTVREICDAAGMNGASVNYHFGDKHALYVAAVRHAHATGHTFTRAAAAALGGPPEQRLRQFVGDMVAEMLAPVRTTALQLLMRELAQPSEATRGVVDDFIRPVAERLGSVLGELLPDATPLRRRMVAYSVVGQCLFYRQNRAVLGLLHGPDAVDALGPDAVARHISDFTLAALGRAAPIGGQS